MPRKSGDSENPRDNIFGRQNQRYVEYGGFDFKLKIDLPSFIAHLSIEDYLDWEHCVNSFFDYMNVPEERQAKLMDYKLTRGASAWWEQV